MVTYVKPSAHISEQRSDRGLETLSNSQHGPGASGLGFLFKEAGMTTTLTVVFGASYVAAPGKIFDSICQTKLKNMSFWEC